MEILIVMVIVFAGSYYFMTVMSDNMKEICQKISDHMSLMKTVLGKYPYEAGKIIQNKKLADKSSIEMKMMQWSYGIDVDNVLFYIGFNESGRAYRLSVIGWNKFAGLYLLGSDFKEGEKYIFYSMSLEDLPKNVGSPTGKGQFVQEMLELREDVRNLKKERDAFMKEYGLVG